MNSSTISQLSQFSIFHNIANLSHNIPNNNIQQVSFPTKPTTLKLSVKKSEEIEYIVDIDENTSVIGFGRDGVRNKIFIKKRNGKMSHFSKRLKGRKTTIGKMRSKVNTELNRQKRELMRMQKSGPKSGRRNKGKGEGSIVVSMPLKAHQQERSTGTVKWFSDFKGYGFIAPDNGDKELFFHQSEIKSDGYPTLRENDVVEFLVSDGSEGKTQAVDVTGPGGAPISGKKEFVGGNGYRRGGRGGRRIGNGNNGGGGAGLSTCYNCGGVGHMAKDCPSSRNSSAGCYNCGDTEHFARDCPSGGSNNNNNNSGNHYNNSSCYNCGQSGHIARECNNGGGAGSIDRRVGGSVERRGGGGGGACYTCGQHGHMSRDCVNGGTGNRSGGGGGRDCYNCGKPGHFARECTSAA